MSAIQTSLSFSHRTSGLSTTNSNSRTSIEDPLLIESFTLLTAAVTLDSPDLITPRDYAIRNISGSNVLISLDGGSTWPLSLLAGEANFLSLDLVAATEVSAITATADVASSLDAKYFVLEDRNGTVGIWFDVDNNGTAAPAGATACDRQIEVTGIVADASATAVAVAVAAALDADAEFLAPVPTTALVTVTDRHPGARAAITAGDTTWTVANPTAGAALPVVQVKSAASSLVQVMIVPN